MKINSSKLISQLRYIENRLSKNLFHRKIEMRIIYPIIKISLEMK